MQAFHGANQKIAFVAAGSWITLDPDVAKGFAEDKVEVNGGKPVVYVLDIDDSDVDWDVISMTCGVDDERGTLLRDHPVVDVLEETSIPKISNP